MINESLEGRAVGAIMGAKVIAETAISTLGGWRGGEKEEAIENLKVGKTPDINGTAACLLEHGGGEVKEWMLWFCNLLWELGDEGDAWIKAIIVLPYKENGNDCKS